LTPSGEEIDILVLTELLKTYIAEWKGDNEFMFQVLPEENIYEGQKNRVQLWYISGMVICVLIVISKQNPVSS
jgi:hypothetical protein